jgi:hypothetical protein
LRTLSAKHPAALALGIDWSATPPAATPADWIDAHDIPLDGDPREFELKATEAFATDLFRRHDRDLVEALTLSLHAAGVGSAEQRLWHFREMAARFAPGHKTSAYSAFVIDARRLHPDLARGYDGERADVALRHAYPSTAAMTFLARARRNAVVPTSDFFWLKLADRPLWYALNNVGRESFHVEGAAEVAHRIAELERGEAVLPPRVQSAVDGVAAYVAQHSCRPEAVFAAGRTDAAGATPRARAESLNQ